MMRSRKKNQFKQNELIMEIVIAALYALYSLSSLFLYVYLLLLCLNSVDGFR